MPFKSRVSEYESDSHVKLYDYFVRRLGLLLKQDGVAFLYTHERKLLKDEIEQNNRFRIVEEEIFDSGGIFPALFIIERK